MIPGNGNCEQLCFTHPSDASKGLDTIVFGRTCECAFGTLVNGRKCAVSEEYLVFSTRTELRSTHISRKGDTEVDSANPFKPIKNLTNVVGVDFDYKGSTLYFTQIGGSARIAKMNSQNPGANSMEDILTQGINPEGIGKSNFWFKISLPGGDRLIFSCFVFISCPSNTFYQEY